MARISAERTGCTEERFLIDVRNHVMQIIRDQPEYKHIRFRKPDSISLMFDLITWPGYLCYTGDMGTYVFSRIRDMMQFFRTDRMHLRDGQTIYVNLGYWAEKVQAQDKNGGIQEFVPEMAREHVLDILKEQARDSLGDKEARDKRREIYDEVVLSLDEPEHEVRKILYEHFEDSWEWRLTDYTYTYRWACFAIAWGIQRYDEKIPMRLQMTPVAEPCKWMKEGELLSGDPEVLVKRIASLEAEVKSLRAARALDEEAEEAGG